MSMDQGKGIWDPGDWHHQNLAVDIPKAFFSSFHGHLMMALLVPYGMYPGASRDICRTDAAVWSSLDGSCHRANSSIPTTLRSWWIVAREFSAAQANPFVTLQECLSSVFFLAKRSGIVPPSSRTSDDTAGSDDASNTKFIDIEGNEPAKPIVRASYEASGNLTALTGIHRAAEALSESHGKPGSSLAMSSRASEPFQRSSADSSTADTCPRRGIRLPAHRLPIYRPSFIPSSSNGFTTYNLLEGSPGPPTAHSRRAIRP